MSIEPAILKRIQEKALSQFKSTDPLRVDVDGWPILRRNMALFEFLRVRQVSADSLASARSRLESDLRYPGDDSRAIWAKLRREGYDLFWESTRVWCAEFGDPLLPQGVPPNLPGEGILFYIDPDRERIFITTGPVDPSKTSGLAVAEDERRRLAATEASLRELANQAVCPHPSVSLIECPGSWPAMLRGEEILEVDHVVAAQRNFLEFLLEEVDRRSRLEPDSGGSPSRKEERDLIVRLLDSGPVYRAWYNQPPRHGSPCPILWLAPETGLARVDYSGWVACGGEPPKHVRRVMAYGARDGATLARYAAIEQEAVRKADLEHYQELVAQRPAIQAFLDRVQAKGHSCWKCGEVTRRARWVSLDPAGRGQFRCQACGARAILEGPELRPPDDVSLEQRRTERWSCPSCRAEAAEYRAIRCAPGEAWLAVCPSCGCTSG